MVGKDVVKDEHSERRDNAEDDPVSICGYLCLDTYVRYILQCFDFECGTLCIYDSYYIYFDSLWISIALLYYLWDLGVNCSSGSSIPPGDDFGCRE